MTEFQGPCKQLCIEHFANANAVFATNVKKSCHFLQSLNTLAYKKMFLFFGSHFLKGIADGQMVRMPVGNREILITFRVGSVWILCI